jgi:hypothetical protein
MQMSQSGSLRSLLDFINALSSAKIFFRLDSHRDEAVMVSVDVPGERWEVEFFADGEVEVERFLSSDGVLGGEEARRLITELIEQNRD